MSHSLAFTVACIAAFRLWSAMAKDFSSKLRRGMVLGAAYLIISSRISFSQTETSEAKAPQSAAPTRSPQTSLEGENLLFAPPRNFKIGYKADNGSMMEFVPNGETVEDWTEMLTVQIFRNLKGADTVAFLQNLEAKYLTACPGTPKDAIRTGSVNGYVVSMLALKCPKNSGTGKSETTVFRAISGKDALYLVQQAWKTIPSTDAIQAVSKSTACDTRDPGHPCRVMDPVAPPI